VQGVTGFATTVADARRIGPIEDADSASSSTREANVNQLTGRWRSNEDGCFDMIPVLVVVVAWLGAVLTILNYGGPALFLGAMLVSAGSLKLYLAKWKAAVERRRVMDKSSWPRAVGETTVFEASPVEDAPTTIVNGLACVVTFTSSSGERTCFDVSPVGHRTGDQVTVIYDAENPSEAYLLTDDAEKH
jgi:hypothetical protein